MYNNNLWVMEQKPHVTKEKGQYIIMEKKKLLVTITLRNFIVMQLKLTKPNNVAN